MKVGNHYNQSKKRQDYLHGFACHLPNSILVKLVRDPISVGIDPVRSLSSVFCGVRNTIEVVSNIVSVRGDENWQSSQSIFKSTFIYTYLQDTHKSKAQSSL